MPYRDLPRGIRRALRVVLALVYGTAVGGGVSALAWAPPAVVDSIGAPLAILWSALVIVGGAGGLLSIVRDRYRWELAAAPVLAAGVGMYSLTSSLLALDEPTRAPSAAMTAMLALFCVFRSLELLGHDRKVRPFLEGRDR